MKKILLVFGLALFSISAILAQRTISGTVVDETNEALIGAAVQVKGTTIGVITDFDGNYVIEVPSGQNVLVISYIGYVEQEVTIGASNVYDIQLELDSEVLEDVVVVGYGQKATEELTGSVGVVGAEKIEAVPMATFDNILQGQTAGLVVLGGSGQPGTSAGNVKIRGSATISGGNAPMFIMDGMEITGADYSALNPNDIESVSVLKDASSAAIYGSRGANGVIVVKTKRGKKGQTQYNYRGQYGVGTFTNDQFEMMNSQEKLDFERLVGRGPGWTYSDLNPGAPENWQFLRDSLTGINTNWRDELIKDAEIMMHELSARGGTERTQFYLSGQYWDEAGQFKKSELKRGTLRFNIDHRASDAVTVGLSSSLGFSRRDFVSSEGGVNLNNPFAFAYLANPYEQIYLPDGSYQFGAVGRNPFEEVFYNDRYTKQFKGVGNLYLEVKFLKDFKFRTSWGLESTGNDGTTYLSALSRLGTTVNPGNSGQLSRSRSDRNRYIGTNTLTYTKRIADKHRLEVLGGQEFNKRVFTSFNYTGYNPNPDIKTPSGLPVQDPNFPAVTGGGTTREAIASFFGRADYNYDDRYNVSVGVRRDGSSVFGENYKWGTFWNAGVAWIASREAFLRDNNVISFLKISANYGTLGNDAGIGDYEWLGTYAEFVYNSQRGIAPGTPRNDDLKWEVANQANVGIELGFIDNKINAEVNLYNYETTDLFIDQTLSRTTGNTSLSINGGEMRNRGVEVELNVDVVRNKSLFVTVGGNFAYNDNEVTSLGQVDEYELGTSIVREGLPLGSHFVVGWAGVDPTTGNPLYYDLDGNVTTSFSDANAVATFGTYNPPYSGGFNLEVGYKGLKLTAFANWVAENTIFNNQTFFQENPSFTQFNQLRIMNTAWQEPGDITEIQRLDVQRQFSSKDLEDASFFRLRNVNLSYTLDKNQLGNLMDRLRVFVQGQNLLTLTKFTGFDPEINNNIAQYEYPAQRTFTFGVEVGF